MDGLIAVIDLKFKQKTVYPLEVAFNPVGDSFLLSDTRGNVTLF
jgi:hypothetical protein